MGGELGGRQDSRKGMKKFISLTREAGRPWTCHRARTAIREPRTPHVHPRRSKPFVESWCFRALSFDIEVPWGGRRRWHIWSLSSSGSSREKEHTPRQFSDRVPEPPSKRRSSCCRWRRRRRSMSCCCVVRSCSPGCVRCCVRSMCVCV